MTEEALVYSSHRREERLQPLDEICGLLTVQEGQRPFLVFNVSGHGIGVLCDLALESGASCILTFSAPYLLVMKCRVVWCRKQGDPRGYHVGLQIEEGQKALYRSVHEAFAKASRR